MNRSLATFIIITFVITIFVVLLVLALPVIVREFAYFIESFPHYVRRLHGLATDSNRPWVRRIVGEGLGEAERSVGNFYDVGERLVQYFPALGMVGGTSFHRDSSRGSFSVEQAMEKMMTQKGSN